MNNQPLAILFSRDEGHACRALAQLLRDAGQQVLQVAEVGALVEQLGGCGLVLLAADDLPRVREALAESGHGAALVPVVSPTTHTIEQIAELWQEGAADVIAWPLPIAVAIERLQTLQRGWRQSNEAERNASRAQLLADTGTDFDLGGDFEEALSEALQRSAEVTEATRALLVVLHEEEEEAFLLGTSDDPTAFGIPVDLSIFSHLPELLRSRMPRYEARVALGPRVAQYDPSGSDEPEGAVHLQPLVVEGHCFGALELHLGVGATLDAGALDFLARMSALLAPRIRLSATYQALGERTRRRHARAVARARREATLQRYRDFYERASDGVVVLDPELCVLYLNPMGEQITGYAVNGIAGRPFVELIPERQREPFSRLLSDIEQWQSGQVFDLPLRTTSGDPIIVSVSTSARTGGEDLRVLSFRDITEARALSEELRHTKEFLERLIDSTVDAIVAGDVEGRLILFNQGAERVFGYREAEVLGSKSFDELFPKGTFEALMQQLRSPSDGGVGRLEVVRNEICNAERELVPVRLSASIIYENGVEMGTVAVISDLRERLHIERRLVQAQERLVDAEKQALIAELAGTTAHELNQPLTSVMGYAQLLQRRIAEDDSNHHAAEMILQECERLAEIVRKIGKITRYETKEYVGRTQILDLDKASEDV